MTSWTEGPLLGFDLETTSADPLEARIVQFAFVMHDPTGEPSTADDIAFRSGPSWTLVANVNPGIPIPPGATAVHGIADEDVTGALDHGVALAMIAAHLIAAKTHDVPIVGMNLAYDLSIVDRCLAEIDGAIRLDDDDLGPVFDLLVIDRHVDKWRKGKRTLSHLARHYGVDDFGAHDAGADAQATIDALLGLGRTYPSIAAMPPATLTLAQIGWHRTWATSFDRYLKSRGGSGLDPAEFEWPVRSIPVTSPTPE